MKVFIKVKKLTIRKDRKFKLSYYRVMAGWFCLKNYDILK